jgi:hypothetical protein
MSNDQSLMMDHFECRKLKCPQAGIPKMNIGLQALDDYCPDRDKMWVERNIPRTILVP